MLCHIRMEEINIPRIMLAGRLCIRQMAMEEPTEVATTKIEDRYDSKKSLLANVTIPC